MLTQNHDKNFEIFHRNISWTKGTETKVRASRDGLEFVVLVWSFRTARKLPVLPTCLACRPSLVRGVGTRPYPNGPISPKIQ